MKDEGGSNYLCLPTTPKYSKQAASDITSELKTYIFGVQFQMSPENLFNILPGSHYDVFCSVCKIHDKSSTVMLPARVTCPKDKAWKLVYRGFLMSQKTSIKRTEYICVDQKPNLRKSEYVIETGYLSFVESRCASSDIPCRSKNNFQNPYFENLELPCVVCAL